MLTPDSYRVEVLQVDEVAPVPEIIAVQLTGERHVPRSRSVIFTVLVRDLTTGQQRYTQFSGQFPEPDKDEIDVALRKLEDQ